MAQSSALVLITRPHEASERFARALEDRRRANILIAPVIEIVPETTGVDTAQYDAVLFTSLQAVALTRGPLGQTAFCVGDATARSAARAGFHAISASGTSDDLVARVAEDAPGTALAHIRGAESTGDVAERLTAVGFDVDDIVAYRQVDRAISPEDRARIADAGALVAPVFSARSAARLSRELGVRSGLTVVAISAAAAKAWGKAPATLVVAEKPTLKSMLDAVEAVLDSDSHIPA